MKYFTLDQNGNPVHELDPEKWRAWFISGDRSAARSIIGTSQISTLFIAMCEDDDEKELVWETVVAGGVLDGVKERCGGSHADAMAMHKRMVLRVKDFLKP